VIIITTVSYAKIIENKILKELSCNNIKIFSILNYKKDSLNKKYILKKNKEKWKQLPTGNHRIHVSEILRYSDNKLLNFFFNQKILWDKIEKWEIERYSKILAGKNVLEIGPGFGYHGIEMAKFVKKWTFADINRENLIIIKRLCELLNIKNVDFQYIENIFTHNYKETFSAFYAHGVLLNIPFDMAKKEFENIDNFLESKSFLMFLMYPRERWEAYGKPSFEEFGKLTDGEDTPWVEYYDFEKMKELLPKNYQIINEIKWGENNIEFVNFEVVKN
jgi:hypothetical protein